MSSLLYQVIIQLFSIIFIALIISSSLYPKFITSTGFSIYDDHTLEGLMNYEWIFMKSSRG